MTVAPASELSSWHARPPRQRASGAQQGGLGAELTRTEAGTDLDPAPRDGPRPTQQASLGLLARMATSQSVGL